MCKHERSYLIMKKELLASIREKEIQLAKLRNHIDKSDVCSDLYNKILIEKAILKKQLEDSEKNTFINKIKNLVPRKNEKLICDYFNG